MSFNYKTNQINPLPSAALVSSVLWTNSHLPCSPPRLFCRSDFRTQQYGDISLWGTGAGARGGVLILLNLLNQQVNKSMRPMTLSSPVLIRGVRNTDTIIHPTGSESSSSPPTLHSSTTSTSMTSIGWFRSLYHLVLVLTTRRPPSLPFNWRLDWRHHGDAIVQAVR